MHGAIQHRLIDKQGMRDSSDIPSRRGIVMTESALFLSDGWDGQISQEKDD
jgi:hypothetical protein